MINRITLHEYDLRLCHYVIDNIAYYAANKWPARRLDNLLLHPSLREYIRENIRDQQDFDFTQKRLLLTYDDFSQFIEEFDGTKDTWEPHEGLHEQYIYTVREVRRGLGKNPKENWSDACGRFAKRLSKKGLTLDQGINIVRSWVFTLRRYLRAMGKLSFLPYPEGTFPTPTCPDPPQIIETLPAKPKVDGVAETRVQQDPILSFVAGGFVYRNHEVSLRGKPLQVLQELWNAKEKGRSLIELQDTVWKDSHTGEETIRSAISKARKALRRAIKAVGINGPDDPIPNVDRGTERTAWRLDLP